MLNLLFKIFERMKLDFEKDILNLQRREKV